MTSTPPEDLANIRQLYAAICANPKQARKDGAIWIDPETLGEILALFDECVAALKAALPYVQRVAATNPTEPERCRRQIEARHTVASIEALLAKLGKVS